MNLRIPLSSEGIPKDYKERTYLYGSINLEDTTELLHVCEGLYKSISNSKQRGLLRDLSEEALIASAYLPLQILLFMVDVENKRDLEQEIRQSWWKKTNKPPKLN